MNSPLSFGRTYKSVFALGLLLSAGACGGDEPIEAFVEIQGAAIDGSEDPDEPEPVQVAEVDPALLTEPRVEGPSDPAPVAQPIEAPLEEPEQTGPLEISFWDLALEELDADAMLDVLLFPEEWSEEEREELSFPPDIIDLLDREIELEGYVIPGKIKGGYLQDFMLVRDLQACCFGGAPRADEWIDVLMDEGTAAEYHRYLPVIVTGRFGLGGMQDNTGKALGVFKLAGMTLRAKD
ncbi:MAG: hypothetical protein ACI9D0_001083 [Bacteroidia bacterium]|jgi:hypothetical protein